jgi:hypothetical protein
VLKDKSNVTRSPKGLNERQIWTGLNDSGTGGNAPRGRDGDPVHEVSPGKSNRRSTRALTKSTSTRTSNIDHEDFEFGLATLAVLTRSKLSSHLERSKL